MEIKSYVVLAAVSLILFILATSMMTVAFALLCRETYKGAVVVYEKILESVEAVRDWYEFIQNTTGGYAL